MTKMKPLARAAGIIFLALVASEGAARGGVNAEAVRPSDDGDVIRPIVVEPRLELRDFVIALEEPQHVDVTVSASGVGPRSRTKRAVGLL